MEQKVQFGSDTKNSHPGHAAQDGMVSALLAQQGFTAFEVDIDGPDEWGRRSAPGTTGRERQTG